jgi:hypothetical protein
MGQDPRNVMDENQHIEAHITRVAARTASETDGLIAAALRRSWPGGSADRSEPWAKDWVRRWGPVRSVAQLTACSCPRGRCAACN